MKKLIFLGLLIFSEVFASDPSCSSKKPKISEIVNQSNKVGFHLKRKYLKADRKITLGTVQKCEVTDVMARRHKLKCRINEFGIKYNHDLYCICGKIEIVEKVDEKKFLKDQCLTLDEIHD